MKDNNCAGIPGLQGWPEGRQPGNHNGRESHPTATAQEKKLAYEEWQLVSTIKTLRNLIINNEEALKKYGPLNPMRSYHEGRIDAYQIAIEHLKDFLSPSALHSTHMDYPQSVPSC